jgi:hypothetical protein
LDRAVREPDAPAEARTLWLRVLSYVLTDGNLIPARAGKPLRGLLDGVYDNAAPTRRGRTSRRARARLSASEPSAP